MIHQHPHSTAPTPTPTRPTPTPTNIHSNSTSRSSWSSAAGYPMTAPPKSWSGYYPMTIMTRNPHTHPQTATAAFLSKLYEFVMPYTIPWHSTTINHPQNHQHSNIWPLSLLQTSTCPTQNQTQSKGTKQQSQQTNFPLVSTAIIHLPMHPVWFNCSLTVSIGHHHKSFT